MIKLIDVKPLKDFKLFLKYSNGIEGEISLSHLIDKKEYSFFKDWEKYGKVSIDKKTNDVIWDEGISLCKNAIYRQLELKWMMKNFHIDIDKI